MPIDFPLNINFAPFHRFWYAVSSFIHLRYVQTCYCHVCLEISSCLSVIDFYFNLIVVCEHSLYDSYFRTHWGISSDSDFTILWYSTWKWKGHAFFRYSRNDHKQTDPVSWGTIQLHYVLRHFLMTDLLVITDKEVPSYINRITYFSM